MLLSLLHILNTDELIILFVTMPSRGVIIIIIIALNSRERKEERLVANALPMYFKKRISKTREEYY